MHHVCTFNECTQITNPDAVRLSNADLSQDTFAQAPEKLFADNFYRAFTYCRLQQPRGGRRKPFRRVLPRQRCQDMR